MASVLTDRVVTPGVLCASCESPHGGPGNMGLRD